ncbi:hypothetical protein A3K73_03750 [Candidatus Pacearchaeota archaeon RBG_13_36_9]|nr:MAG: hypothetical protein A3K73_03750 [Candidatus Pacearchaeota archaeon RBG_13_36_9]
MVNGKNKMEKQKSPNWELIQKTDENLPLQERVLEAIGNIREKFPYSEPFPTQPYNTKDAKFSLVVPKIGWTGVEEVEAVVDYSTQYRAEGLGWKIIRGTNDTSGTIGRQTIIAWHEK